MWRTYVSKFRRPDRNGDAARRVGLEKGRAPSLWSEFWLAAFPCMTQQDIFSLRRPFPRCSVSLKGRSSPAVAWNEEATLCHQSDDARE